MTMQLPRLRTVWPSLVVLFGVWLQAVGADSNAGIYLHDVNEIRGDFDDSDDCVVHDFTPVGQVLHASGSVGGLLPYHHGQLPDPYTFGDSDAGVLGGLEATHSAVILVLDDFRDIVFSFNNHELVQATDAKSFLDTHDVSHGYLVMSHINALIRDTGKYEIHHSSTDRETVWERIHSNEQTLRVVGVHLGEDRKNEYVVIDLHSVLEMVASISEHFQDAAIVVNMSWIILPCFRVADLAQFLDRDDSETFKGYLDALQGSSAWKGTTLTDVLAPNVRPADWTVQGNKYQTTSVASSGNQGLEFELYPAAFPNVISVGAREADYSNTANVLASGGWFPLAYLCCNGGTIGPYPVPDAGLAYAGTSFAAPSMSVLAAIRADDCAYARKPKLSEPTTTKTMGMELDENICD
ncbi:MAG: S8/S53 family peptidase [Chloroflexi bacterium]|nr:S8/S53 family peptidase [Chloroflexota bacterium]